MKRSISGHDNFHRRILTRFWLKFRISLGFDVQLEEFHYPWLGKEHRASYCRLGDDRGERDVSSNMSDTRASNGGTFVRFHGTYSKL